MPQAAHLFCSTLMYQLLSIVVLLWIEPGFSYVHADTFYQLLTGSLVGAAVSFAVALLLRLSFLWANRASTQVKRGLLWLKITWLAACTLYLTSGVMAVAFTSELRLTGLIQQTILGITFECEQRWLDLAAGWLLTAAWMWIAFEPFIFFLYGLVRWCMPAGRIDVR